MKIDFQQVKLPLDYDPYEEDCCGNFSADRLVIKSDELVGELTITVQEFRSGIGRSYRIEVEGNGHKSQRLLTFIDDDGEFYFQIER